MRRVQSERLRFIKVLIVCVNPINCHAFLLLQVWTASLFYDQQAASEAEADQLIELLQINREEAKQLKRYLTRIPIRGVPDCVQDPTGN
jgi:cyanate lyase